MSISCYINNPDLNDKLVANSKVAEDEAPGYDGTNYFRLGNIVTS